MVATAEQTTKTGNDSRTLPAQTQTQRYARLVFRGLAALFIAGVAAQFLIVGIALFVDGSRWEIHQLLGHALGIPALLMLVASLAGRMTLVVKLLSALLPLQVLMQQVTVSIGDWAGAVHPLNALLMFGIGLTLLRTGTRVDQTRRD